MVTPPDLDAESCAQQGRAKLAAGKAGIAARLLARACAARPTRPDWRNELGRAQLAAGQPAAARASFDAVLDQHPAAAVWLNRSRACERLGDEAAAIAGYTEALRRDPHNVPAWTGLRAWRAHDRAPGGAAAAQGCLARCAPQSVDAAQMHFFLAEWKDAWRDPAPAFAHYRAANAAMAVHRPYRGEALAADFAAAQAQLDAAAVARLADSGPATSQPIFIVGMPRSGTTLVEQILASHPEVAAGGERADLPAAVAAELGSDSFTQLAGPPPADRLAAIGSRYAAGLPAGRRRLTDKLPANFRLAGLIHLALPGATILHVRRAPADTCLSCFQQHFRRGQSFSYDLAACGHYYRLYADMMAHWRRVLPAAALVEVVYEDLVADPEPRIADLLARCGLGWDPACLAFHETRRRTATLSEFQVRRPISAAAVGKWRRYKPFLGPLFAALGDLAPAERSHG